jgi:multiple sugar transport system permease protein
VSDPEAGESLSSSPRAASAMVWTDASRALVVALLWTLFPTYWIGANSLKLDLDIFAVPPVWAPWLDFPPTLKHYYAAFVVRPFLIYAANSLIIAVMTTLISLVFGTMAGYALARFDYPGRWKYNISFWILSTRMMPPIVTIIPLSIFFGMVGLLNTRTSVVIA